MSPAMPANPGIRRLYDDKEHGMDLTIDRLTKQFGSKIAVDRVSTR